jgi:hypothetical protein
LVSSSSRTSPDKTSVRVFLGTPTVYKHPKRKPSAGSSSLLRGCPSHRPSTCPWASIPPDAQLTIQAVQDPAPILVTGQVVTATLAVMLQAGSANVRIGDLGSGFACGSWARLSRVMVAHPHRLRANRVPPLVPVPQLHAVRRDPITRNRPRRPATCTQDPTRIPAGVWSPLAGGAAPTPPAPKLKNLRSLAVSTSCRSRPGRAQSAAPGRRHPGGPIEQTAQLPNPRSRGGRVGRGRWGEPSLGESLRIGLHFLRICGGGGLLLPHERVELASRERRRHGRCFKWPWLIRLRLGKVMVRGVHGAHDAGGAVAGPVVSAFSCHYRNRPLRRLL